MKAVPKISFGIVDVRDVADLHLRAMTSPEAKGQRFLALAGGVLSMHDIALMLKNKMGDEAKNVPTKTLPDWLVRIAALFNPLARSIVSQLGRVKNASNEKAKTLLGWTPRTNEEATMASVESMARFGGNQTGDYLDQGPHITNSPRFGKRILEGGRMQGDKICEYSGKLISRRVLPNPGGGPKMETSQEPPWEVAGCGHNRDIHLLVGRAAGRDAIR